jgi:DNA-binding MarR family transcriptional regulator
MQAAPRARRQGLVAQPLDDDIVVYEADAGTAHRLHRLLAQIWQAADGTRSITELAGLAGVRERTVIAALAQLQAAGLLEAGAPIPHRWTLARTLARAA